jgi:hypothetical protein
LFKKVGEDGNVGIVDELLISPTAMEEVQVYSVAMIIWSRQNFGLLKDDDLFEENTRHAMGGRSERGYDNAESTYKIGTAYLRKGKTGRDMLATLAHETMHNVLSTEHNLGSRGLDNKAVHEFVSDLYMIAFAEKMGWPTQGILDEMKKSFENGSYLVGEEHKISHAQIWIISQYFGAGATPNNFWMGLSKAVNSCLTSRISKFDSSSLKFLTFVEKTLKHYAHEHLTAQGGHIQAENRNASHFVRIRPEPRLPSDRAKRLQKSWTRH